MEDPVFIKLLEYGEAAGVNGLTGEEAEAWARNEEFLGKPVEFGYDIDRDLFIKLFEESFQRSTSGDANKKYRYILKSEYYFRLIEHRELQLTRSMSSVAQRNSIIATVISITAIVVTLILGYIQLTSQVVISPNQLKELQETIVSSNTKKIDSAQFEILMNKLDRPVALDSD